MALFSKGNDNKADKEMEMLAKYGLDQLNDPADIQSVKKIVSELVGTGMMEAGMKLGGIGGCIGGGEHLCTDYVANSAYHTRFFAQALEHRFN